MSRHFKFFTFVLLFVLEKHTMDEKKYALKVEWFDEIASLTKSYTLFYYPRDGSVEMYDVLHRKIFLKRSPCGSISETDLYVGNTVQIFGRELKILGYLDEFTSNSLKSRTERTYAMIKPDAVDQMGEIITMIEERKFKINRLLLTKFNHKTAAEFYQEHSERSFFGSLVDYISSGPVLAMELLADSSVLKWRQTLGPTDSEIAKKDLPNSVRARFGKNKTYNAGHGSDSPQSALRELQLVFGTMAAYWNSSTETSLCLIKPHIVHEGRLGELVTQIQDNSFKIVGLKMLKLSAEDAKKFFEAYEGVWNDYNAQLKHFTSGPCVAVAIESSVEKLRDFVGPFDPETARKVRPNTLRAKFGRDSVYNALHCTDLPTDGLMEVEYFFGQS